MTRPELWIVIVGGALATFAIRLSFIALIPPDRLPEPVRRGLRLVPPAVLSAIILPAVVAPAGQLELVLGNDRLWAGLLATLVAWRTRSTWLTIAVGMVVLWGLGLV
jgi:branched-subunit amino acid transport protein